MRTSYILAVIGCIAFLLLDRGCVRFNYPSLAEFPVQGVDVSHHQGPIQWKALAGPHVKFAYIKASEGGTFVDPRFQENWREAREAMIAAGPYHFFTLCRSGAEQAHHFLSVIAPIAILQLPPAVDLEYGGNCQARPSVEELGRELATFAAIVEHARGCRPLLYVTQDFYDDYLARHPQKYSLWVRNIFRRPGSLNGEVLFWQFANRGRLPGVEGAIDLNVFHGREVDLHRLRCTASTKRVTGVRDGPR